MSTDAPKRVLLSVFACSPLRGSEDGSGWHWVVDIARLGYDLTVLTRRRYKSEIEAARNTLDARGRVRFVYVDLAAWIGVFGIRKLIGYAYIYVWQIHAMIVGLRLQRTQQFDIVHHATFSGIRFPTFLGALGVPLILGPLGGGEAAPLPLRRSYPLRGRLVDGLRDLSNFLVRFDPFMDYAFRRATHIVLKTRDSVPLIPRRYRHKISLEHRIGTECPPDRGPRRVSQRGAPRVLFVGRCLYWKGMHLGVAAFARLAAASPNARLTIVGDGPERSHWRQIAGRLGVAGQIDWIDWVDHREIGQIYAAHDIFLFPSLHDSGGNVVYEAAANRLPIVCLDLGGPGMAVNDTFGIKIGTDNKTEDQVVGDLGAALRRLAEDDDIWLRMSSGARGWAESQTWSSRVRDVYRLMDDSIAAPPAAALQQIPG